MLTQSWRSKSAVFCMHSSLTSHGYSKSIKAVRRQRNLGLLTVLPPDRTCIQGSIQDTATTEDDIWRQTTSPITKTDQDVMYSGKSCSYGTTTPTTRLQLVIYWRSVAAFILPVCRVFSDIVWIWMNRLHCICADVIILILLVPVYVLY